MASFQYFDSFSEALAEKVHNLGSDTLKVMLTNTAPDASDTQKSDITDITAEHGYSAGGTAASTSSSAQTSGTYKLVLADVTFTAAGGTFGPFEYAVLYNDTATNKELVGFWSYGSAVTPADGEAFTVDFDASAGVLTLAHP